MWVYGEEKEVSETSKKKKDLSLSFGKKLDLGDGKDRINLKRWRFPCHLSFMEVSGLLMKDIKNADYQSIHTGAAHSLTI